MLTRKYYLKMGVINGLSLGNVEYYMSSVWLLQIAHNIKAMFLMYYNIFPVTLNGSVMMLYLVHTN